MARAKKDGSGRARASFFSCYDIWRMRYAASSGCGMIRFLVATDVKVCLLQEYSRNDDEQNKQNQDYTCRRVASIHTGHVNSS